MRGRLERLGKRAKHAPSCCAGVVAMACTHGRRAQHGKPHRVVGRGDQPEAGDGQRGRDGVAERPVVPRKPGNAGGGKGPQFKTGAERGEARAIGATLGTACNVRLLPQASHAEAKKEPGDCSGERTTAQAVAFAVIGSSPAPLFARVARPCSMRGRPISDLSCAKAWVLSESRVR